MKSHQEAYASAFTAPFSFLRTVDDDLKTTSWAAYANASYALTEQLRLSAGVRYTNEEKKYARTTSTFSTLGALNGTFAFKAQETWDDVSPMVSLDYQATDDVFFYGRVSKGFKSGGFNGRANTPGEEQPYAPETAISYEAGVKTELFDKRARANFTVFYNDYQDFQARVGHSVTSPTQPIPAIDFTVLNAGQLKIYGAELELAANPIAGLSLNAEVGYLHAEYGEFSEQRAAVAPATGFTTLDRSWQTPAFSPEWTARLAGRYEWDLGDTGFVSVGAQARYRSEMALAIDNANLTTRVRFPASSSRATGSTTRRSSGRTRSGTCRPGSTVRISLTRSTRPTPRSSPRWAAFARPISAPAHRDGHGDPEVLGTPYIQTKRPGRSPGLSCICATLSARDDVALHGASLASSWFW
uniref:TonB-dependent receptor n=1 Tax=Phenylobacterium glaciei TaxID=2803784 RepID=A0A974P2H1_9CAUL|nr:TonB-dependent receptor [Phenylobacterium glaciei]